jgi:hypothetical protein
VLRKTQINNYQVPFYPELSVKESLVWAEKINGFAEHMPDSFMEPGKKTDREFFYGIFGYLAPALLE